MCRRTLEIGCLGFGNKKLSQVRAKVLISKGGRHFNDPLPVFKRSIAFSEAEITYTMVSI